MLPFILKLIFAGSFLGIIPYAFGKGEASKCEKALTEKATPAEASQTKPAEPSQKAAQVKPVEASQTKPAEPSQKAAQVKSSAKAPNKFKALTHKIAKQIDAEFPGRKHYGEKDPFETIGKIENLFNRENLLSLKEIEILLDNPANFSQMSLKEQKKVIYSFVAYVNKYYSEWFMYPSENHFLKLLEYGGKEQNLFSLLKLMGYSHYYKFILDVSNASPNLKENFKRFLTNAYIRAMENNKREKDSTYSPPNIPDILKTINEVPVEMSIRTLSTLLGHEKPHYEADQLFPKSQGLILLKERAKQQKPQVFTNFLDSDIFYEQALKLVEKLKDPRYNGFIVSSVTAKVPLFDSFFNTLLTLAKKKKMLLVLIATNKETELLPEVKMVHKDRTIIYHSVSPQNINVDDKDPNIRKLYELEDVFVIAHDTHISNTFIISGLPLMPKNFNPFASLNRVKDKNTITIFGHPQLQAKVESSDNNSMFPTILLSSGSISIDAYPYTTHVSARLSSLASQVHKAGAWIFEKPDKDAGIHKSLAPGLFHFYPIYFGDIHEKGENIKGIVTNDGKVFLSDGRIVNTKLEHIILGDLHIGSTDPKMYKILTQVLKDHPSVKNIILHDHFDGASINHHEKDLTIANARKTEGQFTLKAEYEKNVRVINDILALNPQLNVVLVVSNHPHWLTKLLEDGQAYKDPVNSPLLTEIRNAIETSQKAGVEMDPFEYLYKWRKPIHEKYPIFGIAKGLSEKEIYVSHPDRVKILKPGESFYGGSHKHPIILHGHGHNYQGGRFGVGPANSANIGRAVVGHTHSPGITRDVVNVGTSTVLDPNYTKGNMVSNWVHGLAFIFSNTDTAQLFIVQPSLEKYRKMQEETERSEAEIFGEGFPLIKRNDNERVQKNQAITDQSLRPQSKPK